MFLYLNSEILAFVKIRPTTSAQAENEISALFGGWILPKAKMSRVSEVEQWSWYWSVSPIKLNFNGQQVGLPLVFNKLTKLRRCISRVHFTKIHCGKIYLGKIYFGKIYFGKIHLGKIYFEIDIQGNDEWIKGDLKRPFHKNWLQLRQSWQSGNVLIFQAALIQAQAARCNQINADDRIHSDCCIFSHGIFYWPSLRPWSRQWAAIKTLGGLHCELFSVINLALMVKSNLEGITFRDALKNFLRDYLGIFTCSDFHSVGVSGPLQSVHRSWDVIYFLKGMNKTFSPDQKIPENVFKQKVADYLGIFPKPFGYPLKEQC